jgi:hypothetical protein
MAPKNKRLDSEVLRAACSGFVATAPMTAAMFAVQRLLPRRSQEKLEPRQVSDAIVDRVAPGVSPDDEQRRGMAVVAHFAYGTAMGAAFPAVERVLKPLPARGPLYGLGLFALSYAGWLPALQILPPPTQRTPGRNTLLVISHLVWGAALEAGFRRFAPRVEQLRTAPPRRASQVRPDIRLKPELQLR